MLRNRTGAYREEEMIRVFFVSTCITKLGRCFVLIFIAPYFAHELSVLNLQRKQ